MRDTRCRKILSRSLKIAVGSSLAIFVAQLFRLQNATSAGIITLITIVTTRHETVQLSYRRVMTFFLSVLLACVIFQAVPWDWVDYGIYLFVMAIICQFLGWDSTISLNAVIGTHFLASQDFSVSFILNELSLVLIGIIFAILLNLFSRAPGDGHSERGNK